MPQGKRNSSADFGDILASFDRKVTKDIPTRSARKAEPEVEAGPDDAPRPKNWLRRFLGNISLPWPSSIGGFGPRPSAPYAEETIEAQTASPADPPLRETPKLEAARLEPAKTEDQAIAEELGLSPELATVDLKRIRRDFAKKNIPPIALNCFRFLEYGAAGLTIGLTGAPPAKMRLSPPGSHGERG